MIVILGGGYAGLSALSENSNAILVDRKSYFTLTPWLIDFVCGIRNETEVKAKYPKVIKGEVSKIDYKEKRVIVGETEIKFDKLIVSLGHHQNLPRLKGAKEFAHKIETFEDAVNLKSKIETSKNIVIIGGGATGVEIAGNLRGKNVTLVQRRDRLLPTMSTASSERARTLLEENGVKLLLGTEALEVKKNSVVTSNGEIKSEVTVFAGGLKGPSIVEDFGHTNKNHRMIVDKNLRSIDYRDVFGAGDCATFSNEDIPMSAEVAISAGKIAMRNALGEENTFIPRRTATILRVNNFFFGDFGNSYIEGDMAKIMRGLAYVQSLVLPARGVNV
ncbi:pyridine nucleotide-disulfide oxidoreductase [Candidatus Acidianus copahuensis]|uniref:NADH:ubiquinone reductase (non-electrogenic) n=1 Tax=Candidatus Acidianus copahuensis TaxID=1160895 RepID=A0A031LQN0_9CREN|nr:FAD-dependent oxidoreductase [Candidatus Acidianus copahuensis]EZQ07065.1 pyridine nucleotide-disulfide oxidoreductase [Candidatus Acidianus copahuensis]